METSCQDQLDLMMLLGEHSSESNSVVSLLFFPQMVLRDSICLDIFLERTPQWKRFQ